MRKIIILVLLIGLASCSSNFKNKRHPKKYVELDSLQISNIQKSYSLRTPSDWYSYIESHGLLQFSPRELKEKNYTEYSCYFRIHEYEILNKQTFHLDSMVSNLSEKFRKSSNNYKDTIIKSNGKFGAFYILSSENSRNKQIRQYLEIGDKYYILTYSTSKKDNFFTYFYQDAIKIFDSFKIK